MLSIIVKYLLLIHILVQRCIKKFQFIALLVLVLCSGCSQNVHEEESFFVHESFNDIQIKLYGNKQIFNSQDEIEFVGEVEYIGSDSSRTIISSNPIYFFTILNFKKEVIYETEMKDEEMTTKLVKGNIYRYFFDSSEVEIEKGTYFIEFSSAVDQIVSSNQTEQVYVTTRAVEFSIKN